MKIRKALLCLILLAGVLIPAAGWEANAAGPTLTTTLRDGITVRNDRMTIDVWAKNGAGKKIASAVTLNGARVDPAWDDGDKTSYTLVFSQPGENTVAVSAAADGGKRKQLTCRVTYQPAEKGEIIGRAVWSVEAFTIGCGYLIPPTSFPIRAGESAAAALIRLLHENGLVGYYGGSAERGFYLAYLADGTASAESFNGYRKSGAAANPKRLGIVPSVPDYLQPFLQSGMDFYDPSDYQKNWTGYLGEFVISSGAGWMYCVDNAFPNVGFSERYLFDGDVVRVQLTLGYGADIGGMSAVGGQIPGAENQPQAGYYSVANKDALTRAIAAARESGLTARSGVKRAYSAALAAAEALNASQGTVDEAVKALEDALKNPGSPSGGGGAGDLADAEGSEAAALPVEPEPQASANPPTEPAGASSRTAPEEPAPPENPPGEAGVSEREAAPGDFDSAGTAPSEQSADPAKKIPPPAGFAVGAAVLAAAVAALFGIRLHRGRASSRSTKRSSSSWPNVLRRVCSALPCCADLRSPLRPRRMRPTPCRSRRGSSTGKNPRPAPPPTDF